MLKNISLKLLKALGTFDLTAALWRSEVIDSSAAISAAVKSFILAVNIALNCACGRNLSTGIDPMSFVTCERDVMSSS